MEKLKEKLETFEKAFKTFEEALNPTEEELKLPEESQKKFRDSKIQRFEYTIESLWKLAKKYLSKKHSIELNSPKEIMRSLLKVKIATPEETEKLIDMLDMRNLTSHMYYEEIAEQLEYKLPEYYKIIKNSYEKIKADIT